MEKSISRIELINQRNRIVGFLILAGGTVASITQPAGGLPLLYTIFVVGALISIALLIIYSSYKKKYQVQAMYLSTIILTFGGLAGIPDWESYIPLFISLLLTSLYENWKAVTVNIVLSLALFYIQFHEFVKFESVREVYIFLMAYFLVSLIILANTIAAERIRTRINKAHNELERLFKKAKDGEEKLERKTEELEETLENLQQAQKQLVESEKMIALGNLVAGVAHEINTPLGIGVTAITHLDQKTKEFIELFNTNQMKKKDLNGYIHTVIEATEMINTNLTRASELVKSFKQVAVDQSSEVKRKFHVKEYLSEILLSLKPKLNKTNIKIHVECPEDLYINSYPGDFSQIFTNFIINSLSYAFEQEEFGEIFIDIKNDDDKLIVTYQDTGKGMSQEVVEKIFEPFFTTNRGGGGTGLGMHIVYNIVTQRLKGSIQCESTLGKGTQFNLVLPIEREFAYEF